MTITSSSIARGVGVGTQNIPRSPSATDLDRKILLMGCYDETNKTSIVEDEAILVTSAAEVGDLTGLGFELHRMAIRAYEGSGGVETWIVPVAEESGVGAAATGTITATVTTAVAGTLYLYIANDLVRVAVTAGIAQNDLATAINAAINADDNLPVTSAVATNVCTLTAKQGTVQSDEITITTGAALKLLNEEIPSGVSLAIVAMSGGAGVSSYTTALANIGSGDAANEDFFTECVQGNGVETATLNEILAYVGPTDQGLGTYKNTVSRPMEWFLGDNVALTAGLTALIAITDTRTTDRAHWIMPVPGSPCPPVEIAAQYAGVCARVKQGLSSAGFGGEPLTGIIPGIRTDRWTVNYTQRDTAAKAGIGTTKVVDGVVQISDAMTMSRPANIPIDSNAYAEGSNIGKIQNMLNTIRTWFESAYSDFIVVADVSKVTDPAARAKAKSIASVKGDCNTIAKLFEGKAWVYSAEASTDLLKQPGYISVRSDGRGFIIIFPVLLSGVGKIIDLTVQIDTKVG